MTARFANPILARVVAAAALLLQLSALPVAQAEIAVAGALEYWVDASDAIASYSVVAVAELERDEDAGHLKLRFGLRRLAVLKGSPAANLSLDETVYRTPDPETGMGGPLEMPPTGATLLVFFNGPRDERPGPCHIIRLGATDFPRRPDYAITMRQNVLRDPAVILDKVKERVLLKRQIDVPDAAARVHVFTPASPAGFCVEVQGSPAFDLLYGGSACFLYVPADPIFLPHLLQTIGTPHAEPLQRAAAVYALAAYPGDDSVALLRRLLHDPQT